MISILTPTIRKDGLEIVLASLKRQTFEDFEWLIGSPFLPSQVIGKEVPITWVSDDFEDGFWSLNRIYNKLFSQSKGSLIVSWQDNIYTTPNGLESFWDSFRATNGQALISGVGDQYKSLDAFKKPYDKIWNDPRKQTNNKGTFYECYWNDIEWNWAAIPRQAWIDSGGMDEGLDFLGYGGDQLQMCDRLENIGYKFYLDQTNESYTLRHTRDDYGGQKEWDNNHILFNGKYEERRKQLIKAHSWPKLIDFGRAVMLEDEEGVK